MLLLYGCYRRRMARHMQQTSARRAESIHRDEMGLHLGEAKPIQRMSSTRCDIAPAQIRLHIQTARCTSCARSDNAQEGGRQGRRGDSMFEDDASNEAGTARSSVSAEGEGVVLLPGRVLGRVVVAVTLANASGLRCGSTRASSVLEAESNARRK